MGLLDNPNPNATPASPMVRAIIRLVIITAILVGVGLLGKWLVVWLALPFVCFQILAVILFLIFVLIVLQTFGISL